MCIVNRFEHSIILKVLIIHEKVCRAVQTDQDLAFAILQAYKVVQMSLDLAVAASLSALAGFLSCIGQVHILHDEIHDVMAIGAADMVEPIVHISFHLGLVVRVVYAYRLIRRWSAKLCQIQGHAFHPCCGKGHFSFLLDLASIERLYALGSQVFVLPLSSHIQFQY